jgi:hypothetical protein
MAKGTFVISRIKKGRFPSEEKIYKTPEKLIKAASAVTADSVYTSISLRNTNIFDNFKISDIIHRNVIKINAQWHGNLIKEGIKERRYHAYYDLKKGLLVSTVEKNIALAAINRLNKELCQIFSIKGMTFDFPQLMDEIIDVTNVWFKMKERNEKIRQLALFGNNISSSNYYKELEKQCSVSSICVIFPFDEQQIKVNISKMGSIYFHEDHPLEFCLKFVTYMTKFEKNHQ